MRRFGVAISGPKRKQNSKPVSPHGNRSTVFATHAKAAPPVLASPTVTRLRAGLAIALLLLSAVSPGFGAPQSVPAPTPGQPGKDVVWVPTTPELIERMLHMAEVTPNDFVMDLGSGDGRNVIAA